MKLFPPDRLSSRFFKHQSGVSLVEILLASCVIAVLLGLLLPVISRMRQATEGPKSIVNLRSAHQGFMTIAAENNGLMYRVPHGSVWWFAVNTQGKYVGNPQLAAVMGGRGAMLPDGNLTHPASVRAADGYKIPGHPTRYLSYGLNGGIMSQDRGESLPPIDRYLAGVSAPSRIILMAETRGGAGYALSHTMPADRFSAHHAGRFNAVFLDGHVEQLDRKVFENDLSLMKSYLNPALHQ